MIPHPQHNIPASLVIKEYNCTVSQIHIWHYTIKSSSYYTCMVYDSSKKQFDIFIWNSHVFGLASSTWLLLLLTVTPASLLIYWFDNRMSYVENATWPVLHISLCKITPRPRLGSYLKSACTTSRISSISKAVDILWYTYEIQHDHCIWKCFYIVIVKRLLLQGTHEVMSSLKSL